MNKKSKIKYIVSMIAVALMVMAWFGTKQVAGAVRHLEAIEGYYTGAAVEVGKEINARDIFISAKYYVSNAISGQGGYYEYEDIKKGFTLTPSVIKNKGDNQVVVTYKDKTCVITVQGKAAETITATYIGEEVYVGAAIPVSKIEVYAYFSDGTYEKVRNFKLSEKTVSQVGINTVTVVYEGQTAEIMVYGKAPLAVEELMAYYTGTVIEGNIISKGDMEVQALYNDGTLKQVTNFTISPSIAQFAGENDIVISYGGVETVIQVYAEERYITKMQADRKSTRLNSSHAELSRMPSSA